MAKYFVIFLSLMVIQASLALQCKKCKDARCSVLEDETCQVATGNKQAACLIHVYKEGSSNKGDKTDKRCVSLTKGIEFRCNRTQGEEVTCKTCLEDFCNSSAWRVDVNFSVITAVFLVFAVSKIMYVH